MNFQRGQHIKKAEVVGKSLNLGGRGIECIGAYLKTHKKRVYCLNYCYTDSFTKAKSAPPLHCIISLWRIVDREFSKGG